MSVCFKHRQQRRTSCTCFVSKRPLSDGYGGPDVSGLSVAAFEAFDLADSNSSSSSALVDSTASNPTYHSPSPTYDSTPSQSTYNSPADSGGGGGGGGGD